jgi:hypothetical protein
MEGSKSRLIQTVRALNAEFYAKVRAHLEDETRTYGDVAHANGL